MKLIKATTATILVAVAVLMPACELELDEDCNPYIRECVFTGNHPGGLAPSR